MGNEDIQKLYDILDKIEVTNSNADLIEDIRDALSRNDFEKALKLLSMLKEQEYTKDDVAVDLPKMEDEEIRKRRESKNGDITYGYELVPQYDIEEPIAESDESEHYKEDRYPSELRNLKLESIYVGLLVRDPRQIAMYFVRFEDCYFSDSRLLNIYKHILFTEGQAYASEDAKKGYNFGLMNEYLNTLKYELKKSVMGRDFKMEKVYTEVMKLFMLRKHYLSVPIREIQYKIMGIPDYVLYNQMTVAEVVEAIDEIRVTDKFHQGILTTGLTEFLKEGDNTLTNGISLPFPILTKTFKGVRQQEMMCYSMPSNARKI